MPVTTNPGENEPVRHSSAGGINRQAQRHRSAGLARRRARAHRRGRTKNNQLRELLVWNWKAAPEAAASSGRMSVHKRRSAHPPLMMAMAMPLDKLDRGSKAEPIRCRRHQPLHARRLRDRDRRRASVNGPARVDLPSARHRDRRVQWWTSRRSSQRSPPWRSVTIGSSRRSRKHQNIRADLAHKPNREIDAGPWCRDSTPQ